MRVFRQKQNGKAYRKWTVEIVDHLGTRRKMQAFPDKGASTALGHKLEKLVSYRTARRALDSELTEWIESLPPRMMKRLASIGLIDGETTAAAKPLMVATRKKRKPKGSGRLTPASLAELKLAFDDAATPIRERRAEALTLERKVSDLVNQAYSLTPEEIDLMWRTAPPRMPLPAPASISAVTT
jgi:hypothetical protein